MATYPPPYKPKQLPIQGDQLSNYLRLELIGIQAALNGILNMLPQDASVAPANPQSGMIRRSLSPWLPLSGQTGQTGHRYWRLNCTAVASGDLCAVSALRMATSRGGANIIGSATISASSSYDSDYAPANATSTTFPECWASDAMPAFLTIDFGVGNAPPVAEVTMEANNQSPNQGMQNFTLQISDDGTNFTVVQPFTSAVWAASTPQTFDVAPPPRYVIFDGTNWNALT